MAETQTTEAIHSAAEVSGTEQDELDIARRVHGVYTLQAAIGEKPSQRLRQAGAYLGMNAARVRRYVCLHLAPAEIQEHYLAGRLGARVVELLQALSAPNQAILARRLIADTATRAQAGRFIAYATTCESGAPKAWTDDALTFERALMHAIELLDTYVDAPRGRLLSIFRGAGDAVGRRGLISLIGDQIDLLTTLKQTLEGYDEQGKTNGTITAVADSS